MFLGAQPQKIISHFLKTKLTSNFMGALVGIVIVLVFNVPARLFLNVLSAAQTALRSLVLLGFYAITVLLLLPAIRPSLTRY